MILTRCFIVLCWASLASTFCVGQTVLYETDFSSFSNGSLHNQDGWESQADWQVTNGMITNSGSWQRARLANGFSMQPGDTVRMNIQFTLSGSPNGSNLARFGLAKNNEHTGANMPQVGTDISWSGSNVSVGAATLNNYDSGELLSALITINMLSEPDSWDVTTELTNLTDPMTDEATELDNDSAGSVTSETAWQWLSSGGQAFFGFRNLDNPTSVNVAITQVLFEVDVPDTQPGNATPNILQVQNGTVASGELGDVVESENEYLEFFPSLSQSGEFPVELVFGTFLEEASINDLNLTFESSANSTGLNQVLEVFNWNSSEYEIIVQQEIGVVTDTVFQPGLSKSISDFVNSNTGEIRLRSRWEAIEPTFLYPWKIRIDQIIFDFN